MDDEQLIIFVKAPQPGLVKSRLALRMGAEAACAAYLEILKVLFKELAELRNVRLHYFPAEDGTFIEGLAVNREWTYAPQVSGNLGQRMEAAIRDAIGSGDAKVVLIGSDCPFVTARDIRLAWEGLEDSDVVLGPAEDGGYWLIGMRRIHPALFHGIAWSTSRVYEETLATARGEGLRVRSLRMLRDIDTVEDWRWYLERKDDAVSRLSH